MLDRSRAAQYLQDTHQRDLPPGTDRDLRVPATDRIVSVIGPRRAGKTFYLYQLMKRLVAGGVPRESIVYLNFEDPRLADVTGAEFGELLNLHLELHPRALGSALHVFLDEPQGCRGWERGVRGLHDARVGRIHVTGSSAKLLAREVATSLRGRTLAFTLLPYSFREFLRARRALPADPTHPGSAEEARTKALLAEYVAFGGFPEVEAEREPDVKARILRDYHDLILYRDVVERHRVRNLFAMKLLMKQLFSSYSRQFSVHAVHRGLRAQGLKVSKNTLYNYAAGVEDSLGIFLLRPLAPSLRGRELGIPKVYLADTGFAGLFTAAAEDRGLKIENIVFLEIERRTTHRPLQEVAYWRDAAGKETDFAVREGARVEQLIQVCHSLSDRGTRLRELSALSSAARALSCRDLSVVTWDEEGSESHDGRAVRVVPLWRWLLSGIPPARSGPGRGRGPYP